MNYDIVQVSVPQNYFGMPKFFWLKDDLESADGGAFQGPHDDWIHYFFPYINQMARCRSVIQAGGCLGLYPVALAQKFRRVWTFEPDPANFAILALNTAIWPNINSFRAGLWFEHCYADMITGDDTNRGMRRLNRSEGGIAWCLPFDSLGCEDEVDLILLDVEGRELQALRGMKNLIRRCQPDIIIETIYEDAESPLDFLYQMGYQIKHTLGRNALFVPVKALTTS